MRLFVFVEMDEPGKATFFSFSHAVENLVQLLAAFACEPFCMGAFGTAS